MPPYLDLISYRISSSLPNFMFVARHINTGGVTPPQYWENAIAVGISPGAVLVGEVSGGHGLWAKEKIGGLRRSPRKMF